MCTRLPWQVYINMLTLAVRGVLKNKKKVTIFIEAVFAIITNVVPCLKGGVQLWKVIYPIVKVLNSNVNSVMVPNILCTGVVC